MELKLKTQRTPNPFAYKFVSHLSFKKEGKATFNDLGQCAHIPLAEKILGLNNVTQVHFFGNSITVTQNGLAPWDELIDRIEEIIGGEMPSHDENFQSAEEVRRQNLSPELAQIETILDETIRPSLQMDGGDIEVLELSGNILKIKYEGACGSCPSAAGGTLFAIENTLRENFREDLTVEIEEVGYE